jgi:hypothetical protein
MERQQMMSVNKMKDRDYNLIKKPIVVDTFGANDIY